jgi:uncharacterized protein (TIGR02246 family)
VNHSLDHDLRAVLQRYEQAWNTHNSDSFARLFAGSAHCLDALGLHWAGREEILRALAATHTTVHRNSTMRLTPTHIRQLARDVALVHGTWEVSGQRGIDDQPLTVRKGVMTAVLEASDDMWLIQAYHATPLATPLGASVDDL